MVLSRALQIGLYVVLVIFITSLWGFFSSIHPRRYVSDVDPSTYDLTFEDITLTTSDGVKLSGWFIPAPGKKAIIVTHGYPFDKGNVLPSALFLHPKYNLLFFDFRAMGESGGKITTVGYRERDDLLAAIAFLKKKGMEKIGVKGFSLGAAVAIMTETKDIDAIVADAPYARLDMMLDAMYRTFWIFKYPFVWLTKIYSKVFLGLSVDEVSPVRSIKDLETPVLLIHGEKDSQIDVENSQLLHKANPKNELWIIPGIDHGATQADQGKVYEEKVLGFFGEHLE